MQLGQKAPTSPVIEAMRTVGRDELSAVEFMEARRWGDSPGCPRCGSLSVYTMRDAKTGARNKDFRWRCRDCKRMFTVRTATAFEESRLPLWVWVHDFWSTCSSKNGVSALQISRECEISYKSALLVIDRVRLAVSCDSDEHPNLIGAVDADVTYIGTDAER